MPPQLISYTETNGAGGTPNADWTNDTDGTGNKVITIPSFNAGDILVLIAARADFNGALAAASATGLVFNIVDGCSVSSHCSTSIQYAIAASPGTNVTVTVSFGQGTPSGFGVWVFRGSSGIGQHAEQHTGGSAPTESISMASLAADSAIVWATFDWLASTLGSIVPTPDNTRQRFVSPAQYTCYVSEDLDQPSQAGILYGISGAGSTTGPFSIVALEIKGPSSVTTQEPPLPSDDSHFQWGGTDGMGD